MLLKRMAPASSDSDTRSASVPLVSVRELTVSYLMRGSQHFGIPALTNVNVDVPPRAALGIFGESGCGKTTLLLSMANLLRSDTRTRGSVVFGGRDLLMESEKALQTVRGAQIGVIVQEAGTALNPVRRVGPQVMDVLRSHTNVSRQEGRELVDGALESVGLASKQTFGSWPHQLSGGQRQRVLIARALICGPVLLLADEPTHALDGRTRSEIVGLLRDRSAASGMALVIASHNPTVLRNATDHLFVFYAGQLIESGRTGEVLTDPLHPYTRALVNCFQLEPRLPGELPARMKTIGGAPPQTNGENTGCRFANRCVHRRPACSEAVPALLPVAATRSATAAREVRCILYD